MSLSQVTLVTAEAILDGAVDTADIADGAVTNVKVSDVDGVKLVDNSVVATKLAAGVMSQTIIAGGAAGDHVVTGIAVGDELVSVLQIDAVDPGAFADLTSEFSITGADTINNAGGTDTTGSGLVVLWQNVV